MKRSPWSLVSVAIFAFALTGCSSAKKRGLEALEKQDFEGALTHLDQALEKDANDVEVKQARDQARDGALSANLIEVRRARSAGQLDQALDLLLKVVERERTWQHPPKGPVAFTQDEETKLNFGALDARVKAALSELRPLRAEIQLIRYEPVFAASLGPGFRALQAATKKAGVAHCEQWKKSVHADLPYLNDFVISYCAHFGVEVRAPYASEDDPRQKDLFRDLDLDGSIQALPLSAKGELIPALKEALTATGWYSAQGRGKLKATLAGQYQFAHTKDMSQEVHRYQVQERYDVEVTDAAGKRFRQTRTRSIDKVHPYSVLVHRQRGDFQGSLKAELAGALLEISHAAPLEREGRENPLEMPEIGLRAYKPDLVEEHRWAKDQVGKLAGSFRQGLSDRWFQLFCAESDGSGEAAKETDRIHRCLRDAQAGERSPAVNTWYGREMGISPTEARARGILARGA